MKTKFTENSVNELNVTHKKITHKEITHKHFFTDNSSNAAYYAIYATKSTIDKIGYKPCYFEDGIGFSNYGTIIIIVFPKNLYTTSSSIQNYTAYIYNSSKQPYWSKKIKCTGMEICFDHHQDLKFIIDNKNQHNISALVSKLDDFVITDIPITMNADSIDLIQLVI